MLGFLVGMHLGESFGKEAAQDAAAAAASARRAQVRETWKNGISIALSTNPDFHAGFAEAIPGLSAAIQKIPCGKISYRSGPVAVFAQEASPRQARLAQQEARLILSAAVEQNARALDDRPREKVRLLFGEKGLVSRDETPETIVAKDPDTLRLLGRLAAVSSVKAVIEYGTQIENGTQNVDTRIVRAALRRVEEGMTATCDQLVKEGHARLAGPGEDLMGKIISGKTGAPAIS